MSRAILAIAACTVACAHALEPLKPAIKPWQRATPNALTAARLAAAPVVAAALATPGGAPNVAAGAFAVASVSDGLDGYLARRWRCESALGAFLDPVADKVLVSATLVMLSARFGVDVAVPAAVIVCREVGVSALREWMAARGARRRRRRLQRKLKTACQMAALPADLGPAAVLAYRSGVALLDLSALLAVYSGAVLASARAGSPAAAAAASR
ncbi:cardiolipin synthase [Aureococcus anophagefferens]|nr:cardiolipin synthase [Aureococcus anophagefferens]